MTAVQVTGIGRLALEQAAAYARERVVWDGPSGSHQGVSHPWPRPRSS
jgi:alkylation response protein AidB-like acyl-CoA dehydrogenase